MLGEISARSKVGGGQAREILLLRDFALEVLLEKERLKESSVQPGIKAVRCLENVEVASMLRLNSCSVLGCRMKYSTKLRKLQCFLPTFKVFSVPE